MTIEQMRADLSAALKLNRQIIRMESSLRDIRSFGGTKAVSGVRGGSGITMQEMAVELAEELSKLREDLRIEAEIIRRKISQGDLDDQGERILLLRYVECTSWDNIALMIGYTRRHIRRLEISALEKMSHHVS